MKDRFDVAVDAVGYAAIAFVVMSWSVMIGAFVFRTREYHRQSVALERIADSMDGRIR